MPRSLITCSFIRKWRICTIPNYMEWLCGIGEDKHNFTPPWHLIPICLVSNRCTKRLCTLLIFFLNPSHCKPVGWKIWKALTSYLNLVTGNNLLLTVSLTFPGFLINSKEILADVADMRMHNKSSSREGYRAMKFRVVDKKGFHLILPNCSRNQP